MLLPSVFQNDLFNDIFDMPYYRNKENDKFFGLAGLMRTDISESENSYEMAVDLPGFSKEDIKLSFDNGYVTVEAEKTEPREEKETKYLRRERCHRAIKRSYYFGNDFKIEDIKAGFKDGILNITVAKPDKAKLETSKTIAIEG